MTEITSLEKALVKSGVAIAPDQKKRLLEISATLPYSDRRIHGFMQSHSLGLGDSLDCLEIVRDCGMQLYRMDQLLDAGYSPTQVSDVMELREDVEPKDIQPRFVWREGEYEFWPPDFSEHISYQNIIFLDKLSGGHHDMEEMREYIGQIRDRIGESYNEVGRKGIGIIIHRMRQMYETEKRPRITFSFDELLNRALCHIPKEFEFCEEKEN